jgi:hypothetical protein
MAYFEYVYQGEDKRVLLQLLQNNRLPPEHALKMFEESLNENIPKFDKEAYERITVEPYTDGSVSIILHEKTGIQVDLNQTSAGRRWYFTYWFLKKTMTPGDLFIIDEPAAMLHPSAQKEILKDIEALAQKGIKVVYSTHSPYLIPKKWQSVHCVTMTEEGTKVDNSLSDKELTKQMKEFVGDDIFDIQTVFDLYTGGDPVAIGRKCYDAVCGQNKDLTEAAKALQVAEETVKSWKRKGKHFRCPRLENVIAVCIYAEAQITDLLR